MIKPQNNSVPNESNIFLVKSDSVRNKSSHNKLIGGEISIGLRLNYSRENTSTRWAKEVGLQIQFRPIFEK